MAGKQAAVLTVMSPLGARASSTALLLGDSCSMRAELGWGLSACSASGAGVTEHLVLSLEEQGRCQDGEVPEQELSPRGVGVGPAGTLMLAMLVECFPWQALHTATCGVSTAAQGGQGTVGSPLS